MNAAATRSKDGKRVRTKAAGGDSRREPANPTSGGASVAEARASGGPDAQARQQVIGTAAYLRAERRGFVPGFELEDWAQAEAEIDALRAGRGAGPSE